MPGVELTVSPQRYIRRPISCVVRGSTMSDDSEMTADGLIEVLGWIGDAGIEVWLDGGWGVDALLETQTRAHKDADVIVALADTEALTRLLEGHGFREKAGGRPENFVMGDDRGREVDIHVVEFDAEGNGNYRMGNGELWVFPARGFSGRGRVKGMRVRCLSPEIAVACHASGYVPKDTDFADMEHLKRRFRVELPPQLRRPDECARCFDLLRVTGSHSFAGLDYCPACFTVLSKQAALDRWNFEVTRRELASGLGAPMTTDAERQKSVRRQREPDVSVRGEEHALILQYLVVLAVLLGVVVMAWVW